MNLPTVLEETRTLKGELLGYIHKDYQLLLCMMNSSHVDFLAPLKKCKTNLYQLVHLYKSIVQLNAIPILIYDDFETQSSGMGSILDTFHCICDPRKKLWKSFDMSDGEGRPFYLLLIRNNQEVRRTISRVNQDLDLLSILFDLDDEPDTEDSPREENHSIKYLQSLSSRNLLSSLKEARKQDIKVQEDDVFDDMNIMGSSGLIRMQKMRSGSITKVSHPNTLKSKDEQKKDEMLNVLHKSQNIHAMMYNSFDSQKTLKSWEEILEESKKESVIDILKSPLKRKYFKLFAAKEISLENILFWETVQSYKKSNLISKVSIAEQIIDTFLNPDSNVGINTTDTLKKNVTKRFRDQLLVEGKCEDDLFDSITSDLVHSTLKDSYMRFEKSIICKQMRDHYDVIQCQKKQIGLLFESIPESQAPLVESTEMLDLEQLGI